MPLSQIPRGSEHREAAAALRRLPEHSLRGLIALIRINKDGIVKRIFSVLIAAALLLGCGTSVAQSVVMAESAASCQIQNIELFDNKNCPIIERIMAGQIVPFGPDLSARDDITLVCEKMFKGFMDETRLTVPESREHFFQTTDNFNCFKARNSKGEKQEVGEWANEARDFGSRKARPRTPYVIVTSGKRR